MEISITEPKSWLRELEIEIEPERVRQKFAETTDYLVERAEIPGFRRGHAPRALVERRFATEIEAQTARELVQEALNQAITEKQLRPLKSGELSDYELTPEKSLRFKVTVEVVPEFDLLDYHRIPVERKKPAGFEQEFERRLAALRDRLASFNPVARPSQPGDYLTVDYTRTDEDGKQIDRRTNIMLLVGDSSNFPELNQHLVGLNAGDEKDLTIKFPDDHQNQLYAGHRLTCHLGVRGIKQKQLPEVDDELAANLGFENLDQLRVWLNEQILADQKKAMEEDELNQIYQHLLRSYDFEPPPSLVNEICEDLLLTNRLEPSSETRAKLMPIAEKKARFQIVIARIARQEGIEVTDEERDQVIAEYFAGSEPDPKLLEQLRGRESFRYRLLQDKVMRFLLEQAQVREAGAPSLAVSPEPAAESRQA